MTATTDLQLPEGAVPVGWVNGCDRTAPAALRFLADHDRPEGGEQRFNSAHLYQIAGEIEATAKKLAAAPHPPRQDGAREGEQYPGDHRNLLKAMTQVLDPKQIAQITAMVLEARGDATTPPAPDEAVEAEREACAELLEQMARDHTRAMLGRWHSFDTGNAFRDGAQAIRARSRRDVGGGV